METFDAVFRDLLVRIGQIRAEYLTVTTGIVRKLIQVDGELFIVFPYAYVIRATVAVSHASHTTRYIFNLLHTGEHRSPLKNFQRTETSSTEIVHLRITFVFVFTVLTHFCCSCRRCLIKILQLPAGWTAISETGSLLASAVGSTLIALTSCRASHPIQADPQGSQSVICSESTLRHLAENSQK